MFDFGGIRKIKIPVEKQDLIKLEDAQQIVSSWLSQCLSIHEQNVMKEIILGDYFLGLQAIKSKNREVAGDSIDQNQKIVENHANNQVTFKVDFLMGDKMQFTHKSDSESDDIIYLDRFLADSGFFSKFREIKKDMYKYGVGVSYTVPRTDIIEDNGRYSKNYNKDSESPFEFSRVSPLTNFVVYSSFPSEDSLFSVSIVDKSTPNEKKYIIQVNTGNYSFIYNAGENYSNISTMQVNVNAFNEIPIIEHVRNSERLGVIELNKDLFDVINLIISYGADAIVDTANNIIVFTDVEVGDEEVKQMRKGGYVKVSSTGDPNAKPNVYTLTLKCDCADLNVYYEQRVAKAYDNAGVPVSSGTTTSGGDTGKARLLGNGWEGATTKIKGDIIGMEDTDYQLLKLFLKICKTIPNTKVNELESSQIEIKYNINPNDNILSKAQAVMNLYSSNMPKEMILSATGLSMDIHTDGNKWQTYDDEVKSEKTDTSKSME